MHTHTHTHTHLHKHTLLGGKKTHTHTTGEGKKQPQKTRIRNSVNVYKNKNNIKKNWGKWMIWIAMAFPCIHGYGRQFKICCTQSKQFGWKATSTIFTNSCAFRSNNIIIQIMVICSWSSKFDINIVLWHSQQQINRYKLANNFVQHITYGHQQNTFNWDIFSSYVQSLHPRPHLHNRDDFFYFSWHVS